MYPVNGTYDQATVVYFNLGPSDGYVQMVMRGWHGTGTYTVDSFGNGNYVDYFNLTVTVATATSTRRAQAHVTGTWACIPQ